MPAHIAGIPVTRIGTLFAGSSRKPLISLRHPDGRSTEVKPSGWEHFRS
jgi:hypothetical protein